LGQKSVTDPSCQHNFLGPPTGTEGSLLGCSWDKSVCIECWRRWPKADCDWATTRATASQHPENMALTVLTGEGISTWKEKSLHIAQKSVWMYAGISTSIIMWALRP
jgi:hypothetical protein